MSNSRAPAKIFFSSLQKAHYSSSNEKLGQEIIKQVQDVAETKIKSEKLSLLPYLHHTNIQYISRTSVVDIQPEHSKELDQVKKSDRGENAEPRVSGEVVDGNAVSAKSVTPEGFRNHPESIPVVMFGQLKTPTVDLTNALVPLALHLKDKKSILVDAVVQDIKQAYSKTSSAIDGWYLIARTQSKTLYISAEEFIKRPGAVRDLLRDQVITKTLAVYNPKQAALVNFDMKNIIEKLKHLIETLTAKIKKLFEKESKPHSAEKKKDEKVHKQAEKKPEAKKTAA